MLIARRPSELRLPLLAAAEAAQRPLRHFDIQPGIPDRVLGGIAQDRMFLRPSPPKAHAVLTTQERPMQGNRVQERGGVLREI
jgi:hypothetical protein